MTTTVIAQAGMWARPRWQAGENTVLESLSKAARAALAGKTVREEAAQQAAQQAAQEAPPSSAGDGG